MQHAHIIVRRPVAAEHSGVQTLVQTVVDQTYGHLWAPPPLPIGARDWSRAWIAVTGSDIAGVVLTHQAKISDLWVLGAYRAKGFGSRLLAKGEAEIAGQGYDWAGLRVVQSNSQAMAFYARHGWHAVRSFRHEELPITFVEMAKPVSSTKHRHW